jgi:hypothetical protein
MGDKTHLMLSLSTMSRETNLQYHNASFYNDPTFREEWKLRLSKDGLIYGKMRYFQYLNTLVHELRQIRKRDDKLVWYVEGVF